MYMYSGAASIHIYIYIWKATAGVGPFKVSAAKIDNTNKSVFERHKFSI